MVVLQGIMMTGGREQRLPQSALVRAPEAWLGGEGIRK